MIMVVTVLGILFVTGVAFMASMSFESELIRVAQQRAGTQPVIDDVAGTIDEFLGAGFAEIIDATGAAVIEQPDTALEALSPIPFAQTPGRFNSFSPVEPYVDDPAPNTPTRFVWGWFTDPLALTGDGTNDFANPDDDDLRIDTAWQSGVPGPSYLPMPVDADGDGIVDANQVNLDQLGFTRRQIDPLAKVLNAEANPTGSVYFGLRIVPHGGMVNLADAHPSLIRELFSMGLNEDLPQDNRFFEPYSPLMEEASLRRRGMLPPRELPPTQLLGSPLDPDPNTSGADYPALYWPNETAAEHRHWPFTPDEFADGQPNKPLWFTRMDPESARANNPVGDDYDRRHLVTSISHDDLLRRATVIDAGGQRMDVVEWALANGIDPSTFPYLDYPSGPGAFANTYTGINMTFKRFDWSDCEDDPDCELNPRKGRLRLSMAWLDEMWATNPALATRVIQDTFTLLLLNARGSEWDIDDTSNDIPPQDLDGDGLIDTPGKRVLDPDFNAIAETAAALTANMIDFADDDDVPTAVEIRSADYTTTALTSFGVGTGEFVYGLENQPYITEVAAIAVESTNPEEPGADPTASSYAIELFNPYEDAVNLSDYFLRINTTTGPFDVELSGFLSSLDFQSYGWTGDKNEFKATKKLSNLDFADGSTIKLMRTWTDGITLTEILVDEFDLDLTDYAAVGLLESDGGDGKRHSAQRYAAGGITNRWYATVPDGFPSTSDTIGSPAPLSEIPDWRPVEAIIANEFTFSDAFPTTGSLLLLMRHANAENEPFNRKLGEGGVHPIDDGRMPIYDVEAQMFHHIDPSEHPTDLLLTGATAPTTGQSGTIEHLPWGQLVFDYFTALPLENPGPYGDYDDYDVKDPLKYLGPELPRVDMDGMQAHGRIDINAAPWFVMKGLPFIPMKLVPELFRDSFRQTLELNPIDDDVSQPIGEVRAQAIAAYRDKRLIKSSDFLSGYKSLSGNYNTDTTFNFGRGWNEAAPKIRRGMGFLSVGELANVRHPAADSVVDGELEMRLDDSVVGADDENHGGSYLEAVAALACLSDWVSVRSQVFTAYGTLRGDKDPTIEDDDLAVQEEMQSKDVDTRAIRFQETIDRLPTFLGVEEPARIGSRVLATYNDVRND